jgi:hypothetical protein
MASNFQWHGLDELRDQMRRLADDLGSQGAAAAIVRRATDGTAQDLRAAYEQHRHTGTLASRVRTRYPRPLVGVVSSAAPHANIFEKGTVERHTRSGANRGRMPAARILGAIAVRHRREMNAELAALLRAYGFDVTG